MYSFPYKGDSYSIIVSGGVDSALVLYYLLLKNKPVNVYTTASEKTLYKNAITSVNVIQKCMELTNNYQVTHQVFYQRSGDIKTIMRPLIQKFNSGEMRYLYTGVTANPPAGTIDMISGQESQRDPNETRNLEIQPFIIQPFTNYDKRWIATKYKELGLLDTLFPVTRSCEHQAEDHGDPGYGHCGLCWWCKERLWAFDQL